MVEVKNLTKYYGDNKAVDDISFTVNDGEILGFLGPNGAGKSTTMNILTGYISSTSGQAIINGVDILQNPIKAKSNIGYLPEIPPLYLDMTVKDYLNFVYDLKKCKLPRKSHLADVCSLVKITDVYGRIIKHLSKGYKQRVGLAQALINNPPVLILDEPTVGLDPKQIIEIRTLVKNLGKNHTVILSSHILSEIQAVCDRVIIINKGRVAANDTAENLSKSFRTENKLTVRIEGDKDEIVKLCRGIRGVKYVVVGVVYEYEIETEPNMDIRRELNAVLSAHNMPILLMKTSDLTLEDIFLKITLGEGIEIKPSEQKEENKKLSEDEREALMRSANVSFKDKDSEKEDDGNSETAEQATTQPVQKSEKKKKKGGKK